MALEKTLVVPNGRGIHLATAVKIANTARKFTACNVHLVKNEANATADAKSVLNIVGLAATPKSKLICRVEGDQEQEALQAMEELFLSGFEEPNEQP